MDALFLPLRALLDPVGAVPRAVEARRWFVALSLACLSTAASGAVIALKLDASRVVIPKMMMSGELMKASEREISEAIEQAQRVALVGGIAKGLLLVPLLVLLLAVVLKITAWLIGKKALFVEAFTVAALTMLPLAVLNLIQLVVAANQVALTPTMVEALVPTSLAALLEASPKLMRVYGAVDLFNVWAALVMGLGFAASTKWSLWKGALFGLFLYVLFACAFLIGGPGLAAGMGGPPGGMGGH
jgi:hypothetical protein